MATDIHLYANGNDPFTFPLGDYRHPRSQRSPAGHLFYAYRSGCAWAGAP